jgi:GT2 family glycosyltransferase
MKAGALSIVIVNWNGGSDILQCLDSLRVCGLLDHGEVLVVDNASEDSSPGLVQHAFPQVMLLKSNTNLGFARAANLGWKQARGEYVLFLNPDTRVPVEALEQMLTYLRSRPAVGITGLKLLNHDGSLQVSCWNFLSLPILFFDNLFRLPFIPRSFAGRFIYRLWDHKETKEVDWVCGACMLMRRSLLEEVGGFSDDYYMY